jgi:hypothetical protein
MNPYKKTKVPENIGINPEFEKLAEYFGSHNPEDVEQIGEQETADMLYERKMKEQLRRKQEMYDALTASEQDAEEHRKNDPIYQKLLNLFTE